MFWLEPSSAASWQINWKYMHYMKKQESRDWEIGGNWGKLRRIKYVNWYGRDSSLYLF